MSFFVRTRRLAGALFAVVGIVVVSSIAVLTVTDRGGAASLVQSVASAISCSSTGTASCFSATNTSSGIAVYGTSKSGTGLRGLSTSNNGLKATSTSGIGVNGQSSSNDGVYGQSSSGSAGVVGTMANGTGVYGYTTTNSPSDGVDGSSVGAYGVYGESTNNTGVGGFSDAENGTGVSGTVTSDAGYGVFGESRGGSAMYGLDTEGGTAVYANSPSGVGVESQSGDDAGIFTSSHGVGVNATGTTIGVSAAVSSTSSYPFVASTSGSTVFQVDGKGDVSYTGSLEPTTSMRDGSSATAFGAKTTAPTLEDTGTAQLVGGASAVRLDPTFAATIDPSTPYRVFLTPGGDSRGLYVANKSAVGFVVRESQGGRSSMSFDYRIVAAPIGHARDRMARIGRDTPSVLVHEPASRRSRHTIAPPRKQLRSRHARP